MSVRRSHEAMDCMTRSTDWTVIGARIVQAAAVASAVHVAERARVIGDQTEGARKDSRTSDDSKDSRSSESPRSRR
jgi:hypothetical protein